MCIDHVNPYDVLAMNGASAALAVSDIPFPTQVGAVRIGKLEGRFVVNPAEPDLPESELDLIVAGTDDAILMVEAAANEATEAEILDALDIAHEEIKKLCAAQRELAEQVGKAKIEVEPPTIDAELYEQIRASHGAELDRATQVEDKLERQDATKAVEEAVLAQYAADDGEEEPHRRRSRAGRVRQAREGRSSGAASPSTSAAPTAAPPTRSARSRCEVGIAPRTHGSALFTRGQTQAFTVTALGTSREEQRLDTLGLETSKRYMHHYNFPPFSVGEAGFMRGPEAPRHRSRGACRAGAAADDPAGGGVPLHDPRRLGHPRVERLLLDGLGLRLDALADGRRREDPQAGGGHRDGPDQGRRRLRRPVRHRGRRGPPRRHGLQDRRHARRASPRSRWTSRSRASRSRS